MRKFFKDEGGLVTIEWVGIAAVMVLAAIAVTAYVMQGAGDAGESLNSGLQDAAGDAAAPQGIPFVPPGGS